MRVFQDYNRAAAVAYAHAWAYRSNPRYYNYEELGGDCTNFASQCLYAGSGIMNFTPTWGWYYLDADRKAPAWTGVQYLWNFLTRTRQSVGPVGEACALEDLQPGDLVQLSFDGTTFGHTPFVIAVEQPVTPQTVFVAAHTQDADYRPLSTYVYQSLRCLRITGVVRP